MMCIGSGEFPGHPELYDAGLCLMGLCLIIMSGGDYFFGSGRGLRSVADDEVGSFWARVVMMACGACIFLTGLLRFIRMRLGF